MTDDSNPQFTVGNRRVICMLPGAGALPKVPPFLNIRHAAVPAMAWTVVVGLLAVLWRHQDNEGEHPPVEWMFVSTDDPMLPVMLSSQLDSAPSILHCPLRQAHNIGDMGTGGDAD